MLKLTKEKKNGTDPRTPPRAFFYLRLELAISLKVCVRPLIVFDSSNIFSYQPTFANDPSPICCISTPIILFFNAIYLITSFEELS